MNTSIYSQICKPANLNLAYAQIRMQITKPAFNPLAVAEYERHLELNLEDLARRLREGGYYTVSARIFESAINNLSLAIRMIEDWIVQRAVFNAIAPLFEPALLDCSFGSYRNRETHMAVRRVLEHRAGGDNYVVKAEICEGFSVFDHDNLIYLLSTQITDQQLLRLIRMWLSCGQALPWVAKSDLGFLTPSGDYPLTPVNSAVMQLFDIIGNDYWNDICCWVVEDNRNAQDFRAEIKKLGLEATRIALESSLLTLASNPRYSHIFTKRNIAIATAAALAATSYPVASQLLRDKLLADHTRRAFPPSIDPQGQPDAPLAGLMTDVMLHRFDVAMTGAGLHLVRYHDKFAITTAKEMDAHFACDHALRELRRMDILLNPEKTRIARFEEGVEFLGYRIHEHENMAELIETDEQPHFDHWYQHFSDVVKQAPSQIGGFAKNRLSAGFSHLKSLVHGNRNHRQENFRHYRK